MGRAEISSLIRNKLLEQSKVLAQQFQTDQLIRYCYIDDLLPEDFALELASKFPSSDQMKHKKSLKEDKFVSAQMNMHDNLLEETLFAFQDERIVELIHKITNVDGLEPDPQLYAGGLSRMGFGQFLKPHLDNSHDKNQEKYRVLNLLYYVSPDWKEEYGGNLNLWQKGLNKKPTTIYSKFNRLIIMETHKHSIHGVDQVKVDQARCCISNYYFSKTPVRSLDKYFHVTSFYGNQNKMEKMILFMDRNLRNFIRKSTPKNLFKNNHYYKN